VLNHGQAAIGARPIAGFERVVIANSQIRIKFKRRSKMAIKHGVDTIVTRLLLRVSLLCINHGHGQTGVSIAEKLKPFRPDLPHPDTTIAIWHVFEDRYKEAAQILEHVLSAFPNHQFARALLGLALKDSGQRGWESHSKAVIEDDRDCWSIELARFTLGYDYKKSATLKKEAANSVMPVIYA
jgi:hypothetical protein